MGHSFNPPFWIGDRRFTADDLALIGAIVSGFKRLSRRELAATVCENLSWRAPNGLLKTGGCRLLLEEMEGAGLLTLPPKRKQVEKTICNTKAPPLPDIKIACPLSQLGPVAVEPVPREEIALFNATVAAHHPLGMGQPFGAHQRYWIRTEVEERILGAMLFAAPARAVADRDNWIGWTKDVRRRFLYRIVGHSRFLILPGVRVPCLASHVLALAVRRLRTDWMGRYGYAPVLLETYVMPSHDGTCYRAANWCLIGETASIGRGYRKERASRKLIFVYPLTRDWRRELCAPMPIVDEDDSKLSL
jgi:hypothetical protein